MNLFLYVIIMIVGVLLSYIANRFIPKLAIPIIQILVGVGIAVLPLGFKLELDPEMFFLLFIAPLVYYGGMTANKLAMWDMRKSILNMAIVFVVITSLIVGSLVHFLIPAISLPAGIMLIASLGPTDDVAVASVGKRYSVPGKLMELLEGESIFNDVSGILLFQITLSIIIFGSFSVKQSIVQFFVFSLGGIIIASTFSLLKILLLKQLRILGIVNETIHVLISLTVPFLIFYVTELFSMSGILAMFTAGILYSFEKQNETPDTINQRLTSESLWEVLTFVLEGMVFIILGTEFPDIINSLVKESFIVGTEYILLYIVLITLVLALLRFIWSFLTLPQETYQDQKLPISKWKASLIFSLSGARGAVTLASVYSIPLVLGNGDLFPQRSLMIVITMGVILCSIVLAYFVLPFFIKRKDSDKRLKSAEVHLEMLQNIVLDLRKLTNAENQNEIGMVLKSYQDRIKELERSKNSSNEEADETSRLLNETIKWKMANVEFLIKSNQLDKALGNYYLALLEKQLHKKRRKAHNIIEDFSERIKLIFYMRVGKHKDSQEALEMKKQFSDLLSSNDEYVLKKLREKQSYDESGIVLEMINHFENSLADKRSRERFNNGKRPEFNSAALSELTAYSLQLEREQIQNMYETGRIEWDEANRLRNNVTLLEMQKGI